MLLLKHFMKDFLSDKNKPEKKLERGKQESYFTRIAFLGWFKRVFGTLRWGKISLNFKVYSRISWIFIKQSPKKILDFIKTAPKRFRREGTGLRFHKKRFELSSILPHLGLIILAIIVLGSTAVAKDSGFYSKSYLSQNIDSMEIADLALSVDVFTPYISESENDLILDLYQERELAIVDESYLMAPMQTKTLVSEKEEAKKPNGKRTRYIVYVVNPGETLSSIAAKFGLNFKTMEWANSKVKNPNMVTPGLTLWVPPADGMTHVVSRGENLSSIVKKYNGDLSGCLKANGIPDPSLVYAGQRVVIPGGKPIPVAAPRKVAKKSTYSSRVRGTRSYPTGPTYPSGSFRWPTSGSVCQGFRWGHPAIDICAGGASPAIVASDGGYVETASYGWNYGYGNYVVVNHGNGFKTLYAHMRYLTVGRGQGVSKGQQVGVMGTTGNSRGIHLHFEVHVGGGTRVNPLRYLR